MFSWRGAYPSFYSVTPMITKKQVEALLDGEFGESPLFFVEIEVTGANDIRVLVDNDNGISIDDCVKVSRFLESSFDREVEDFALKVSSPGADQPLRIPRQYRKNVGRQVAVKVVDGKKIVGELTEADENKIRVVLREKRKIEGRKSKEWVEEIFDLPYDQITETKVVISFK